jgi:tRNA(fMet)-specific endonuclease VapC
MTKKDVGYLLDTGWIVRHLRGRAEYSDKIVELEHEGLAVSVISVAELHEGVVLARNPVKAGADLSSFLSTVTVLAVDEGTCRQFGRLSAGLRKKGFHPGDFDVLIASTALQHGLTVLTTDVDDFSRFEELEIIGTP